MNMIDILLVEDNPGDIDLVKEALSDAKVGNKLHVVKDGHEALAYLRRQEGFAAATRPGIVLLDLNLPRMDGREVLKEVKSDPELRSIPIVVMTTSKDEEDILKAYDLQANCYITKPVDFEQFMKAIRSLEDFWLTVVQLPKTNDQQ